MAEGQFPYGIGTQGKAMLAHTSDCRLTSGRPRPATREQAHVTAYGRPVVSRARTSSGTGPARRYGTPGPGPL
ncbi:MULTISPECIES: hypothetical protein [unclassified Streptomyces]|uniref:hypothetical protein n=1 Tax=unclassified Streptomyces TaxID=2593676 RepID=UPI003248D3FF